MRALTVMPFCLVLWGCSVALYGNQTTSGGATTTTTSAATSASASAGSAKFSASFGTPAAQGASGGQVIFSRGASAFLLLGLVIAETVNFFSGNSPEKPRPAHAPAQSIADTCSCYGYQPPSGEDPGSRIEDRGLRIED